MPRLEGDYRPVDLGRGYVLTAPGLRGNAERRDAGTPDVRAAEQATPLIDDALARNGMESVATIDIAATEMPAGPSIHDLRDAHGDDALLLEVPDFGPTNGQVVLSINEAGALTWHFPLEDGEIQPPAVRGAGAKKRFYIRRRVAPVPPPNAARDRALFGVIGRKLLKVIVYPITDLFLGKPAELVAEYWEKKNRAYGIRDFSPSNYREATATPEDRRRLALTPAQLGNFTKGRALFFIHGTFSNAHGAFSDLPPDFMTTIHQRYQGRVFALNHFTMSHDPQTNVRWFLDEIARMSLAGKLDVDIVCHSRGGLVARTLVDGQSAFGIDTSPVNVSRIAFVGVPNQGTPLTDPDHMSDMIDRFTTVLNVAPPGSPADWLEGLLIAVKILGHGALKGLAGLQSMNPKGKFLAALNTGGRQNPDNLAIAADYDPTDEALKSIVKDGAVDAIFQDAGNDLVVPELGVYGENGSGTFPIPTAACLRLPASAGVTHTTMFANADVQRRLNSWLNPPAGVA